MQNTLMTFDPATGEQRPYPSHAAQWREWHGKTAWLFDPWTGCRRDAMDVGSDVQGLLIVPAGTLGMDTGGGCAKKDNAAQVTRPLTPVGWSDTDWIKHLQEQKEPHPLEGLHINQGSMDAAADAYEAEYYAARRGGRTLDVVTLTGGEYDALCYEIEDLRNVLRKLVEHDVTYWDNKGEVRHDVGASQSEAMAIFREARQLLTPNEPVQGPPSGGPAGTQS